MKLHKPFIVYDNHLTEAKIHSDVDWEPGDVVEFLLNGKILFKITVPEEMVLKGHNSIALEPYSKDGKLLLVNPRQFISGDAQLKFFTDKNVYGPGVINGS